MASLTIFISQEGDTWPFPAMSSRNMTKARCATPQKGETWQLIMSIVNELFPIVIFMMKLYATVMRNTATSIDFKDSGAILDDVILHVQMVTLCG